MGTTRCCVYAEDHALASIQLKAIGPKRASGIPKDVTKASACGLSSLQSIGTSFLTTAALYVDKQPYRRNEASSSITIVVYIDLKRCKIFCNNICNNKQLSHLLFFEMAFIYIQLTFKEPDETVASTLRNVCRTKRSEKALPKSSAIWQV